MKNCQTLSFNDLAENMQETTCDRNDFIHRTSQHRSWGSLQNRTLRNKFFSINEHKADLTGTFKLAFTEEQMANNMNICMAMGGRVGLDLKETNFYTTLSALKHHCVYSNEIDYNLVIDKSVHIVHITVDREYYANLLQESEKTEASMKSRLLNREKVWNGTADMSLAMKRAAQDILYNPLQGSLKSIFIEGKILEIVALQLNDFRQEKESKTGFRDEQVFFELRKYLEDNFTEEMSLRSLSRMFGVNEFKLKKGFKTLFRTTVFDYIHELRMMHARTLLLDEKKLVNEVANVVGYKNANHFSTAFKRKFGVTPTGLKI
jgi:AraC family transcriptional regulator, transcriptional activator of the genes for pyochelin and ferripyochelin receptors